jgi:hypothetical protein
MALDFTYDRETYRNQLRDLGTTISYTPQTLVTGTYGGESYTDGSVQVIPAKLDEMGLDSKVVVSGILEPGDYVASIPGDETVPIHSKVVARSETFKVVKISGRNLLIRKELYLRKLVPDV